MKKDIIALWKLATHYKCLGKMEQALKYYNKVLEINPKEVVSTFEKVFCLVSLNRKKEAYATFENYIKLNPNDEKVRNLNPDFIENMERQILNA